MSYTIKWSPKANKKFLKLSKEQRSRILEKLELFKEDPFRYLEHFEREGVYKLRIGDYRALVEVDFKEKILWIMTFGHRGSVYKNFLF